LRVLADKQRKACGGDLPEEECGERKEAKRVGGGPKDDSGEDNKDGVPPLLRNEPPSFFDPFAKRQGSRTLEVVLEVAPVDGMNGGSDGASSYWLQPPPPLPGFEDDGDAGGYGYGVSCPSVNESSWWWPVWATAGWGKLAGSVVSSALLGHIQVGMATSSLSSSLSSLCSSSLPIPIRSFVGAAQDVLAEVVREGRRLLLGDLKHGDDDAATSGVNVGHRFSWNGEDEEDYDDDEAGSGSNGSDDVDQKEETTMGFSQDREIALTPSSSSSAASLAMVHGVDFQRNLYGNLNDFFHDTRARYIAIGESRSSNSELIVLIALKVKAVLK
jgi:hypothetical protein